MTDTGIACPEVCPKQCQGLMTKPIVCEVSVHFAHLFQAGEGTTDPSEATSLCHILLTANWQ